MDLIKAWYDVVNGNKLTVKGIPSETVDMLKSRASAYHAIECRREERKLRLNRSGKSYYLDYELNWQVAEYYANNYLNGKFRQHPLDEDTQAWHDHDKTKQNKRQYYYNCKYEKVLTDAKSTLSKSGNQPSDDEIIEYLFSQMPDKAFSQDELAIWKQIYDFANTKTEYKAIKRSDRRTLQTMKCTYLVFADWYLNNRAVYSSIDKDFVARMVEYYSNSGIAVPAKKVDELLRYYGAKEYFSAGDLTALGLNTKAKVNNFFNAIDTINQVKQKK